MTMLARLVRFIGFAIATVIVFGILLVVLDAEESNGLVSAILDVARWFTEPFRGIFDLEKGKEHLQIAINWGIGAVVYALVAILIARLLTMAALGGARRRRRHTAVT